MSKKTFIILLVVLGLLYVGAAGIGLMPKNGEDVNKAFDDKFGWLKPKTATADEMECEPAEVFRRDKMELVFTEVDNECTLTVQPKSSGKSLTLKLTCPDGVKLKVTAPNADSREPETKDLPAEHEGKVYSEASFKLKPGECVTIQCAIPSEREEVRIPIGD